MRGQIWYIKRELRRHHRLRMIELKEFHNGCLKVKITAMGQKALFRDKVFHCKIKPLSRWDGKWRVLIFDIPNTQKTARDMLRRRLCGMGFYPIQKSVFVCPFPCEREIKLVKDFF